MRIKVSCEVINLREFYTVIYKGYNLFCYGMTTQEKIAIENFRKELINTCNDLNIPREKCFNGSLYMGRLQDNDEFVLKYKEDIGYFVLTGERGVFSIMNGFPTKDKEEAKFILFKSEFSIGGFMHELNSRDKLEREWSKKYSVEYDFRKAAFEYVIKMLTMVFRYFPDNVIMEYTNYMNNKSQRWYFNKNNMLFEEL